MTIISKTTDSKTIKLKTTKLKTKTLELWMLPNLNLRTNLTQMRLSGEMKSSLSNATSKKISDKRRKN